MMQKINAQSSKKRSNALLVFLLIFVGVIFAVNILLWNTKMRKESVLPMFFGYGCSVVLSGSMEPTLEVNDIIFVKEQNEYATDDIVVFHDGESLVVHRLIFIDDEFAVTKGDANEIADEPISADRVIGKVIGKLPSVGMVVNALKSPVVVIALSGLSLFLMVMSFRSEKESDQEESTNEIGSPEQDQKEE